MLWHPFLLLVRKRLIAIAILALGVPVAVVLSGDVRSLVVISEAINLFLCILIGASLGWTSAKTRAAETRFLFTRPIPRLAVLLRPLIVASFAIAVFPLATFVLLSAGCACCLPRAADLLPWWRPFRQPPALAFIHRLYTCLQRCTLRAVTWWRSQAVSSSMPRSRQGAGLRSARSGYDR